MQSLFYAVSKTVQNCICLCSGNHDSLLQTTFLVLFSNLWSSLWSGGKKKPVRLSALAFWASVDSRAASHNASCERALDCGLIELWKISKGKCTFQSLQASDASKQTKVQAIGFPNMLGLYLDGGIGECKSCRKPFFIIFGSWGEERKQRDLCVQESSFFLHGALQQLSSPWPSEKCIPVCCI